MSRRARWVVVGLVMGAVCAFVAGVVAPAWLLWRVLDAPPVAPEPAEYTDYQVTVAGGCLLIRNTGPDAFFAGHIQYRVARDDGAAAWYEGDQAFVGWGPGEDIVIDLPVPIAPGRVIQFTGSAQKEAASPKYRLRYGPASASPDRGLEDIDFDPDLAAATDAPAGPKP
jgi:hypothetical protein